ncbi:hypothetical protein [Methylotenera sp.]|uniref:hypothetical protein n=1 Tax=Methylotenera sp. TaxID=2051956 RepID=UPI00248863C0|nr:hypothetical protein [Methylotenera sp.]MDI1298636.1 hypothetical protein [Methylotenera sp.]
MTKFSIYDGARRIYFNSEEEYQNYIQNEAYNRDKEPTLLGLVTLFATSWILTTYILHHFNIVPSKNISYAIHLLIACPFAFLGYRYGRRLALLAMSVLFSLIAIAVICWVATWLYKLA